MMVSEHFWSIREGRAEIRKALRQKLELNEFDLVLLYVGKLYPGKRVEDVFKAMQRLAEARIKLLIIGDGEQRAQLEMNAKAAKLPVQFCGFINIDELPQYYCAADVLVHPAELEQFGMVVLEIVFKSQMPETLCDCLESSRLGLMV